MANTVKSYLHIISCSNFSLVMLKFPIPMIILQMRHSLIAKQIVIFFLQWVGKVKREFILA